MKNSLIILIGLSICINSCRMPSNPLGEIKILKRLDTIDTGGNCLDLDVDILDSILVAAANYNGYFVYKINFEGEIVSDISEKNHISYDEMDNSLGDNRAQSVELSTEHNIAFIMDQYDHIWLYKYEDGALQYSTPNYLAEDCYGGTWLSLTIDDQSEKIGVYYLLKHNAAEFMPYCIRKDNVSSIGADMGCSDIEEYFETNIDSQACEAAEEYIWMYPGCQVGNYSEHSTSLVWKNLEEVSKESTSLGGEPNCEYIINQGALAEKIYFNDGVLSMAYGELGVRNYQKSDKNICLVNDEIVSIDTVQSCVENFSNDVDEINYSNCCSNDDCPDSKPNCEDNESYLQSFGFPGLGGKFSSKGGIIPKIFSAFDTPGAVEALYSTNGTIFAGLSKSNGCMIAKLNDDGSVTGPNQFAIGYSINGIHEDNGLLALAAGHDGILLYKFYNEAVLFIGKIKTSYANNVKVAGDIIIAATEDGIELIQILIP